MATVYAQSNGNINAAIWATTPTGSPASHTFVNGDIADVRGHTINLNIDPNTTGTGLTFQSGLSAGQLRISTTITINSILKFANSNITLVFGIGSGTPTITCSNSSGFNIKCPAVIAEATLMLNGANFTFLENGVLNTYSSPLPNGNLILDNSATCQFSGASTGLTVDTNTTGIGNQITLKNGSQMNFDTNSTLNFGATSYLSMDNSSSFAIDNTCVLNGGWFYTYLLERSDYTPLATQSIEDLTLPETQFANISPVNITLTENGVLTTPVVDLTTTPITNGINVVCYQNGVLNTLAYGGTTFISTGLYQILADYTLSSPVFGDIFEILVEVITGTTITSKWYRSYYEADLLATLPVKNAGSAGGLPILDNWGFATETPNTFSIMPSILTHLFSMGNVLSGIGSLSNWIRSLFLTNTPDPIAISQVNAQLLTLNNNNTLISNQASIINDGNGHPGLCTRGDNGDVVLVYISQGYDGAGSKVNNQIVMQISQNNGISWGNPTNVTPASGAVEWGSPSLLDMSVSQGKVYMSLYAFTATGPPLYTYIFVGTCSGHTITWDGGTRITTLPLVQQGSGLAFSANGTPIWVLKTAWGGLAVGTWLMSYYGAASSSSIFDSAGLSYSTDNGVTWTTLTTPPFFSSDLNGRSYSECAIFQPPNSGPSFLIRNDGDFSFSQDTNYYLLQATDVTSFSQTVPCIPRPVIETTCIGRPAVFLAKNGQLIMSSRGPNKTCGYITSWDYGNTWSAWSNLNNDLSPCDYTAITPINNGNNLLLAYCAENGSDEGSIKTVTFSFTDAADYEGIRTITNSGGSGTSRAIGPFETSVGQRLVGVQVQMFTDLAMSSQVAGTGTVLTNIDGIAYFTLPSGTFYSKATLTGFTFSNPQTWTF